MNTHKLELIKLGCRNLIAGSTIMGSKAECLYFQRGDFGKDPRHESWFNDGFPYRIWRETGLGFALGRNTPDYGIDGQCKTAEDAVARAGIDGVVVLTGNN